MYVRSVAFAVACLAMALIGCGSGPMESRSSGDGLNDGQLSVSTTNIDFGNVVVNSTQTQSVTLTSTGTSPVTVNTAASAGAGFSIVGTSFPVTLNPSQSVALQVQFSPTTTGSVIGQLTINSNSTIGATAVVALSGTGTAANSQLTVSPGSLSFGSVTVNTGATQWLTLTSTGTSPVTVNSDVITGAGFTIVASSFPVTLNPSQALTLQVQFDPTTTGPASGQITINSNSATGGTALVALGGTGTVANPQLTISTANLSFGSVAVNTATTQSLIVTSSGTSAVTVTSAAVTGPGFSLLGGSFPVTLNPGQTLTLQVQFSPTATGAANGQITVSSNSASGGTALVALSGTSTAATAHEVDLSWDAPVSSADPVAGYNVYRSTGSGSFGLINLSPDVAVVYVDSTVVSGTSYSYFVKSVDSSGVESVASNQVTVTIP